MPESESPPDVASASALAESRWRRPARFVSIGAAMLFGVYLLVGYFVVPRIVESQLVSIGEAQLGVEPSVEAVRFDPLRLRLTLEGFSLPDPSNETPSFAFESLALDARLVGFLTADVALDEIVLVGPQVSAVMDEDGELNLARLLDARPEADEEPDTKDEGDDPLVIDVRSIRLIRGNVHFVDRSQTPAFDVRIEPLGLDVERFSTRAGDTSPYAIELSIGDDTRLEWKGTFGVEPIRSEGTFRLTGFDLRLPWDYLSPRLRFEIAQGRLEASARYALDLSEGLGLSVAEGHIAFEDARLLDPEAEESALELGSLSFDGIGVEADDQGLRVLHIAAAKLAGGALTTHLARDGAVRLVDLFEPIEASSGATTPMESEPSPSAGPEPSPAPASTPQSETRRPEIVVEQVSIADFDVSVEDRGPTRPVAIRLPALSLDVTGWTSEPGARFDVSLSSGVGDGGRLSVAGPVVLAPLDAQLAIEASRIGLADFQAYLDRVARLDVSKGALSGKLGVVLRQTSPDPTHVEARGSLRVDELLTLDRDRGRPFMGFERFEIKDLEYLPERLQIGEVVLAGAQARYAISRKGGSNFDAVLVSSAPPAAGGSGGSSETSGATTAEPLAIEIAKVTLDGLRADVADRSIEPPFSLSLGGLTGTIEGLSSKQGARAKVALAGSIDGAAPVRVNGQINPLSGEAYTDIAIEVRGVDLPAFTPYSGRYVGYRIDRGKLGLDLHYKLNANHLEAKNEVRLEQFAFGESVASDQATSLPVPLALAVMKNTSGDIEIGLPIEGDIDDPSFDLFGLLGKAAVNLITRAATAPFSLVSGLVSSSAEDLAHVVFPAGEARWVDGEEVALADLAELLSKRASLRVEIRGRADPEVDGPALRRSRIEEALRLAAFQSLSRRARGRLGTPDALELDAEQRLEQLERLYRERVGGRLRDRLSDSQAATSGDDRTRTLIAVGFEVLAPTVELAEDDWRELARARASTVQAALLANEQVGPERLFMVDVEVGPVGQEGTVATDLDLRAG